MNLSSIETTAMNHAVAQNEADLSRSKDITKIADEYSAPGGKCDPYDKDNFVEAIDESRRSFQVRDLLRSGDEVEAGHVLKMIVEGYWHEKSLDAAESELDRRIEAAEYERASEVH